MSLWFLASRTFKVHELLWFNLQASILICSLSKRICLSQANLGVQNLSIRLAWSAVPQQIPITWYIPFGSIQSWMHTPLMSHHVQIICLFSYFSSTSNLPKIHEHVAYAYHLKCSVGPFGTPIKYYFSGGQTLVSESVEIHRYWCKSRRSSISGNLPWQESTCAWCRGCDPTGNCCGLFENDDNRVWPTAIKNSCQAGRRPPYVQQLGAWTAWGVFFYF